MAVLFANNATATLASGISAAAGVIPLAAGQGARFPSPSGGDYFYTTLVDASNNIEIVKCTSRTGDNLTVTRAQEGTTARIYSLGDKCELRITAQSLVELNAVSDGSVTTQKLAASAVTTAKLADQAVDGRVLANNAVGPTKIADGSITTAKIVAGAVDASKLAAGAAIGSIGFTPVRQGGTAEIKLTWVEPFVYGFVNNVAQGKLLFESAILGATFSAGYRGLPPVPVSTTITLDPAHNGKMLVNSAAGVTNWIPQFADVAIDEGAVIHIANVSGAPITIGQGTGVSLINTAAGSSGTLTLANFGFCRVVRVTGNTWFAEGNGLS